MTVVLNSRSSPSVVWSQALLLERLEARFYELGQAKFSVASFTDAGLQSLDHAYFELIAGHEKAHVAFLESAAVLGAQAKPPCEFDFGSALDSVQSYIATSAAVENLGVGAYDGAINAITNPDTAQAAATIATVEARHAAYLNKLNSMIPVNGAGPNSANGAFDWALQPSTVVSETAGFIKSCPFNVTAILPQVRPGGVFTATTLSGARPSNANPLPGTVYTQEQYNNDNIALNYALVLEHLEADFYKTQQTKFTRQQFIDFFTAGNYGLDGGAVYDNLGLVAAHEAAHVGFIKSSLDTRAPDFAYSLCTYNWTAFDTIPKYIAAAALLEDTGVSAYDGAVNAFTDTSLQQAAATVATVEARHASYLSLVAKTTGASGSANPFPGSDGTQARDNAVPPSDVLAAVNSLNVQTCPFTIQTPVSVNRLSSSASVSAPSFALFAALAVLVAVFHM